MFVYLLNNMIGKNAIRAMSFYHPLVTSWFLIFVWSDSVIFEINMMFGIDSLERKIDMILHQLFSLEIDTFLGPTYDMESILCIDKADNISQEITKESSIARDN